MKITSFTKPTLKSLRVDLNSALDKVAKEYGIEITTGNISFSGNNATIKVEASVIGENGSAMTKEATDFTRYAKLHQINAKVGDTFTYGSKVYTIEGWKTRASKTPIVVGNGGKSYRVSIDLVKNSFQ
tara:strand:- start:75 stop:458 length:384 start_codon:yes stop_codon:yes gene_type:complete